MVVKVYISGISGNKEVKKRQQRVLMILDSKNIKYEVIDITEPGRESDKEFMQNNSKSNGGTVSDPNPRSPLPPQIFNDEEYCGDYDQFDLANEIDTLEQFVKVEVPPEELPQANNEEENAVNGVETESKEEKLDLKDGEKELKSEETSDEKLEVKESSTVKEGTPPKDAASKEGSPTKDEGGENEDTKEDSKDKSLEKETPDRQKSVEKENTPDKAQSPEKETEQASKEHTPDKEVLNENGTVSSRDHSEEKEAQDEQIVEQKDNPSETLIESEQAAATE